MLATIALPETRDSARSSAATIALEFAKLAAHRGDHHVSDLEADARVRGIDHPGAGRDPHDPLLGLQLRRHGDYSFREGLPTCVLHPVNRRGDEHSGAEQLREDKEDESGTAARRF